MECNCVKLLRARLPSLKDGLVVERGVGGGDEVSESVVLAEPHRVHRLQAGVLVGAGVAGQELILNSAKERGRGSFARHGLKRDSLNLLIELAGGSLIKCILSELITM